MWLGSSQGGGFQSTVADLARFGAALGDEQFLGEPLRKLLFESQKTSAGQATGYSMGLNVQQRDGHLFVSHGGAQNRTRTFLLCAPEEGLTVALMCNAEGSNLRDIGQSAMRILLGED
jgi:CubicO group peptidase (beta-lactamase class C family)